MYNIRLAKIQDAAKINIVTKKAFLLYKDELHSSAPVKALTESDEKVIDDILNHHVFVAEENGEIFGAIRYCALNANLAYIYRFGVDPDINNTGIGSDLLNYAVEDCIRSGYCAIALHTNSKYYKLARYYYGKQFFVHSTTTDKGYIRALFIKELNEKPYDITPAYLK